MMKTETGIEQIERVLNQQMRVLNAMVIGKAYSTDMVAEAVGMSVTRTRRALNALAKVGKIIKAYGHEHLAGITHYGDERDESPRWVRM